MIDVKLEYLGNGQFRTANRTSFEAVSAALDPGDRVRARLTRPRSVQQNEFFHALCEMAHDNQSAGFRQPTWRHLKSWLLIEAGHCDVQIFRLGTLGTGLTQFLSALRHVHDNVQFWTNEENGTLIMKTAKSVSFRSADRETMHRIVDRVIEIICTDIVPGLTPDAIRDEAERRTK